MNGDNFISAVIVSAGNSSRMGGINKQLIQIDGMPVIARSIKAFQDLDLIDEIVIVTREADIDLIRNLVKDYGFNKVSNVIAGGETRQLSVFNGVMSTSNNSDFVAIHDGARPLVTSEVIIDTVNTAIEFGAATTGVKVKDTVKQVNDFNEIVATPNRNYLRFVQTPQVFKKQLYLEAANTIENSKDFTDDCMLIEAYGRIVCIVDGDYENIKITTPEDIELAENYIKKRGE